MNNRGVPIATIVVQADGRIIRWDAACEQATGYPAVQMEGATIEGLFSFAVDGWSPQALLALAGTTSPASLVRADGRHVPLYVQVAAQMSDSESIATLNLILLPPEFFRARPVNPGELRIADIIEELPCVVYMINDQGQLILWNHRLEEFLEMTADELHLASVQFFFDEKDRQAIVQKVADAFAHGQSSIEAELVGKHGRRTSFLFQCARTNLSGQLALFGTGLDISARKHTERGLQVRERALYSSVNAIVITCGEDGEQRIEYVNPAFEQITGYTLAEIRGKNPRFMRVDDQDVAEHKRLRAAISRKQSVRSVLRNRRKNGEIFWNDLRIDPVENGDGEVTHFVAVISDITEARHYERRLHHLAHHDPLTGLANRTLLIDRLKLAIDNVSRSGQSGALAYLDLDNFKHINDSLGHDAGDMVLREIADRLRAGMRDDDTIARVGGDEFVLLLQEYPDKRHIAELLERVRRRVGSSLTVAGKELVPSTSVGISVFPDDGDNVDAVMRAADAAMYHAKTLGKNNVQFYSAELGRAMHQRLLQQASLNCAFATSPRYRCAPARSSVRKPWCAGTILSMALSRLAVSTRLPRRPD